MKSYRLFLFATFVTLAINTTAYAGTWVQAGPTWSYTKDDGEKAVSQWVMDDGRWYYLDDNGMMRTGWLFDNGKWYFLGSDGVMFSKQYTPKGYYCGADGAWIENYAPDYGSSGGDSSSLSSSGTGQSSNSSGENHSGSLNSGLTDGPD